MKIIFVLNSIHTKERIWALLGAQSFPSRCVSTVKATGQDEVVSTYLLALVERSLEVLLMLALLSRFLLGVSFSGCWWVEDEEEDDEELVLARESSSDMLPTSTEKRRTRTILRLTLQLPNAIVTNCVNPSASEWTMNQLGKQPPAWVWPLTHAQLDFKKPTRGVWRFRLMCYIYQIQHFARTYSVYSRTGPSFITPRGLLTPLANICAGTLYLALAEKRVIFIKNILFKIL